MTNSLTESANLSSETSGSFRQEVRYRPAPAVLSMGASTETILGQSGGVYVSTKVVGQYVSSEIDVARLTERKMKSEIRRSL